MLASILFIFIWGGGYLLEKNILIHKIFYENQEFLYKKLLDATHTATTPALLLP